MSESGPIKLLHIITGLDTGGAEMALYRLLSRLSPTYQVHVISLTSIGEVGKRIQELGVPVDALGMRSGIPNPIAILRLAFKLRKIQPDIVHTWMYHADLMGGLAARLAMVSALTWSIRNTNLSPDRTKRTTRAVVRVCGLLSGILPDRIISCSQTARDIHVARGYDESRFVIIPNGFDLSSYRPDPTARVEMRQELGIPAEAPVIGLVARLDPLKNHQGFFEAAGILHFSRPDVNFVLAGKDIEPGNPAVAAWMRAAGVEHVTHLLGLRNDIPRLTAAFDVATSSSWGEAFPNVVGEAMACGVPCVVTDVGDSAFIVGDTGLVVKPGDVHALAAAWEKLLMLSPSERQALGQFARTRVAENFELQKVTTSYEAFYEELIMKKGRKA